MPGAPREPTQPLRRDVRRVVLAQALLTLLVAAAFAFRGGGREALAACYGGAVTILISGWLGWRLRRAGERAQAVADLGLLYSSAMMRYAAAIVLLALGLGALKLSPVPLVVAFGLAQFGFLASARRR
ncbi:MAG: ATP synthase subunit I [Gammaproteobacteria bacterium]|nr:ATP synthase subunit I [Gammaproteobacteria bacterium]